MSLALTIAQLEQIVADCRVSESRAGYFAAMYLGVTRRVEAEAAGDRFLDASRMEVLATRFAARYLDAYGTWSRGGVPTRSWVAAFTATHRRRPVALQHLLLGMNAHINLDLGVAAAEVAPGAALPSLQRDFDAINDVLSSHLDRAQDALDRVSPALGLVDRFGGRSDEEIFRFSLRVARRAAWRVAERLAPLADDARAGAIDALDRGVAGLAGRVLHPGPFVEAALLVVRLRERRDPSEVIDTLARA